MSLSDDALRQISVAARDLERCVKCQANRNTERGFNLPGQKAVHAVLDELIAILFPGCHGHSPFCEQDIGLALSDRMAKTMTTLKEQIYRAFEYQCQIEECDDCGKCEEKADQAIIRVLNSIHATQEMLQTALLDRSNGFIRAISLVLIILMSALIWVALRAQLANWQQLHP